MLIPTSFKNPLRTGLAYPIGAEALSRHLAGVPQYSALSLSFGGHPALLQSQLQDRLRSLENIPVIAASYSNIPSGLSAPRRKPIPSFYGEHWSVYVCPVLREHRHSVNALLASGGLVQLHEWLSTPRPDTWRVGRHYCELSYAIQPHALLLLVSVDGAPACPLPIPATPAPRPGAA